MSGFHFVLWDWQRVRVCVHVSRSTVPTYRCLQKRMEKNWADTKYSPLWSTGCISNVLMASVRCRCLTIIFTSHEEEASEAQSESPAEESLVYSCVPGKTHQREPAPGTKGWIPERQLLPPGNSTSCSQVEWHDARMTRWLWNPTGWEHGEQRCHQERLFPSMVTGKTPASHTEANRFSPYTYSLFSR